MIYESYPWKQDLLRRKRLIQQYNYPELLGDDNDRAYTVIEKAIFYSAFIIRKLIDCKGKVSDEVDKYSFTIKGLQPEKEVNFMNRWPENGKYDWEHEVTYTKPGTDICNWLIHSYVFFFTYDTNERIDGFYVSSDYDRNKVLYWVALKEWIAYMEFVGKDYVVAVDMHFDNHKKDYIFTKKSAAYYDMIMPRRRPMAITDQRTAFCFYFTPPGFPRSRLVPSSLCTTSTLASWPNRP